MTKKDESVLPAGWKDGWQEKDGEIIKWFDTGYKRAADWDRAEELETEAYLRGPAKDAQDKAAEKEALEARLKELED